MSALASRSYIVRQHEVGEIIHEGRVFSQSGSSVTGKDVTGYLAKSGALTRWTGGQLIPANRYVKFDTLVYGEYWDKGIVCGWRLPGGRWIVGWSLDSDGSLFRGELVTADDDEDAEQQAKSLAEYWIGLDCEDQQRDQDEQNAERFDDQS